MLLGGGPMAVIARSHWDLSIQGLGIKHEVGFR
jgi:hypothetical protein